MPAQISLLSRSFSKTGKTIPAFVGTCFGNYALGDWPAAGVFHKGSAPSLKSVYAKYGSLITVAHPVPKALPLNTQLGLRVRQ
jgi:hypothetical protein